jgi:hypothetical protein
MAQFALAFLPLFIKRSHIYDSEIGGRDSTSSNKFGHLKCADSILVMHDTTTMDKHSLEDKMKQYQMQNYY